MTVPAYTTPGQGGITIPGNAAGGDISNLMRGVFDGSNDGDDPHPENGLETAIIPRFTDLGALMDAYPSPGLVTPVIQCPALVRVFDYGDDIETLLRPDSVSHNWIPMAGFADMNSDTPASAIGTIVNPGDVRGVCALTVPALPGTGQRLVTVTCCAGINYGTEDDNVELILRVNGSTARQSSRGAPKSLFESIEPQAYSFFINPGAGFTLQTLYSKRAGTGTCTVTTDARYTNLQFVSQDI